MTKTALLFTGQGSQIPGMGFDFCEKYTCAKEVFEIFNNEIGRNIANIAFNGSDDTLKQTINSQPCILAVELAIYEVLKNEYNIKADFVAGHSLGEYAALYVAGVIDLKTAAKLISARANAMAKVNTGTMSAIIGLTDDVLQKVIQEASAYGYVDAANYNTPEQTVITGETEAVLKANELALVNGAKRAIQLAVSGAFHSKLMKEASEEFSETVNNVQLSNANIPVITNVDAKVTTVAEDFRNKMISQVYSSVHWVQTLNYLQEQNVGNFIEIGPSKILSGMVRKTLKNVNISAISKISDLEIFNITEHC